MIKLVFFSASGVLIVLMFLNRITVFKLPKFYGTNNVEVEPSLFHPDLINFFSATGSFSTADENQLGSVTRLGDELHSKNCHNLSKITKKICKTLTTHFRK